MPQIFHTCLSLCVSDVRLTVDTVTITKLEAASRQLDAAIRLLFAGDDIVAVHALGGGASLLLSKLIEIKAPNESWDQAAQNSVKIDSETYFAILRKTQNFLKHAHDDPDGVHEFYVEDTASMMMGAVMNLMNLQKLTRFQEVYQLWFLACILDVFPLDFDCGLNHGIR
jgi:hypothetical protein